MPQRPPVPPVGFQSRRLPTRRALLLVPALALPVLLGWPSTDGALADVKIRVLSPTPLAATADVPAKVKEECPLGQALPLAIARANRNVVLVNTPQELMARSGRYFLLEIVEVSARGGGVWSGPKRMVVRGIAYADGKPVGDIEAGRGSTMAFSACSSLEKVEKTLGQDLGRWLVSPKPRDRL
jgi:hypothetical protein